mmetsp:Transcript_15204/g.17611  ORF Transcript_15204/g.17611 Transcript_15204/m.17611 type:complete len:153 (+) Transcript_15204:265-723(+)
MGSSAIFRISFILMLFHIAVLVIIAPRLPCSAYFHDGCWVTKFTVVLAAFILSFWIPNGFFRVYGYISLICSFFFLIFQGIIIMGACYSLNDHFLKLSDTNRAYLISLLVLTIVITLISVIFIILEFVWFHACWANNLLILVPVIFTIGYVV